MSRGPKWGSQLVLAASLFILGGFAYWFEYSHRPKEEAKQEQQKKVFSLKNKAIESVQIRNGDRDFLIKCAETAPKQCKVGETSKWDLEKPIQSRADDTNVSSLLSSLSSLEPAETIDLKDETPAKRQALLKEYGLDPASRAGDKRIGVKATEGSTVVYFGLDHPTGEGIFAVAEKDGKIDDTQVFIVPTYFKSNWEQDLTHWRDKKILGLQSHEIAGFKLDDTKAHITAERQAGAWTLHAKGEDYPGDLENIDTLLSGVSYLVAKDFASKAALAGAKPVITLTLQPEKKTPTASPSGNPSGKAGQTEAETEPKPITLVFYSKGTAPAKKGSVAPGPLKVYVTSSAGPNVYEVDAYAKERFDKDLNDLRLSKLLTSVEKFTAKRLEFSGKPMGSPLVLLNQDGKWAIENEKTQVDQNKVQSLLDRMSSTRIREFLNEIPKGEEFAIKFAIRTDQATDAHQYDFWRDSGKLYARDLFSKRKEAFLLDPSIGDVFPWNNQFFTAKPGAPPSGAPAGKH